MMDDNKKVKKEKRVKPIWIWLSLFVVLVFLCIASIVIGGGLYIKKVREQATETKQAELWITATAQAHSTGTALAQSAMTSTAQSRSTATARAQFEMTSTAQAAATGTALIYANRTSTAYAIDTRVASDISDISTRFAPLPMTLEACARPLDVMPANWRVAICDEFDNNEYSWPTGDYDEDLGTSTRTISNGVLRWITHAKDAFFWPMMPSIESFTDFYATVDIQVESGPDNAAYGIQFRWDEGRDIFYQFVLSEMGSYAVFARINDEWIPLIDWREHSVIRQGMFNTISVLAHGPALDFYINGQRVDAVIDRSSPSGTVGLFVSLYDPGDEAVFVIDHFEVRAP